MAGAFQLRDFSLDLSQGLAQRFGVPLIGLGFNLAQHVDARELQAISLASRCLFVVSKRMPGAGRFAGGAFHLLRFHGFAFPYSSHVFIIKRTRAVRAAGNAGKS